MRISGSRVHLSEDKKRGREGGMAMARITRGEDREGEIGAREGRREDMRPGAGRGWVRSTEGAKEEGARRTSGWAYGGGEEMRAYLDGGRGLVERRVELETVLYNIIRQRLE